MVASLLLRPQPLRWTAPCGAQPRCLGPRLRGAPNQGAIRCSAQCAAGAGRMHALTCCWVLQLTPSSVAKPPLPAVFKNTTPRHALPRLNLNLTPKGGMSSAEGSPERDDGSPKGSVVSGFGDFGPEDDPDSVQARSRSAWEQVTGVPEGLPPQCVETRHLCACSGARQGAAKQQHRNGGIRCGGGGTLAGPYAVVDSCWLLQEQAPRSTRA